MANRIVSIAPLAQSFGVLRSRLAGQIGFALALIATVAWTYYLWGLVTAAMK
jgi:hypothetical protein